MEANDKEYQDFKARVHQRLESLTDAEKEAMAKTIARLTDEHCRYMRTVLTVMSPSFKRGMKF